MATQIEKSACAICGREDFKILIKDGESNVVQCRHCNLIYRHPGKSKEESEKIYTYNYYTPLNKEFWYKTRIDFFKRALKKIEKIKPKGRLLDLGCGFGYSLDLAKRDGWEVWGVEISNYAIQYARKELGLNIFQGELKDARFGDNYFEVVTMWNFLEHLYEPFTLLREVNRILKEDGLVAIRTQNMYFQLPLFNFFKSIEKIAQVLGIRNPFVIHNYGFPKDTLKTILKSAGFRDIQIVNSRLRNRFINFIFYSLAQLVFYFTGGRVVITPALEVYAFK